MRKNEIFKMNQRTKEEDMAWLEASHHRDCMETYNDILNDGIEFFHIGNNPFLTLDLAYEALIHFMLTEEYEKCAHIRKTLDIFYEEANALM